MEVLFSLLKPRKSNCSAMGLKMNSFSSASSIKFNKEESRLYKNAIFGYISKIKPLYLKVSKLRFFGTAAQSKKQSTGKGSRLRKSRSAVFAPKTHVASLQQQEDAIEGAIAYCKRSFHSEKGVWATDSPLLRSMSDPGGKRSLC